MTYLTYTMYLRKSMKRLELQSVAFRERKHPMCLILLIPLMMFSGTDLSYIAYVYNVRSEG